MWIPRVPWFVAAVLLACCAETERRGTGAPSPTPSDWRLVWSDEFDTPGLPDPAKWYYDTGGHGWGNKELQFYTERRAENARVEAGHLIIEARRERWEERDYTSVRLNSRPGWTYGRIEVRAKLPSGRGTWPAVWMLPVEWTYGRGGWPDNGEIDIMEHVGFDPDVVHASIHTQAYNHVAGTQKTARLAVPGARDAFHVYVVEWTDREIKALADDRLFFSFSNERLSNSQADYRQWPFDKSFRVLLNIAVGGTWGGQQGVDDSIWPQRMEVDYVRVFERSAAGQFTVAPDGQHCLVTNATETMRPITLLLNWMPALRK
jgi:beta-glucanase (GH16 family)